MVDLTAYLRRPVLDDFSLERFVGSCLALAGFWKHWRESDGISTLLRYEGSPERLRVCGCIYQISDQQQRYFWLDVTTEARVRWRLGLDPHSGSERRARSDLENCESFEELDWDVGIEGEAELRDGLLVPTSVRAIAK